MFNHVFDFLSRLDVFFWNYIVFAIIAVLEGTSMHRQKQTPVLEHQGSLSTTLQSLSFFSSFKALKRKPSLVTKRKQK
jgi:integral membrane sensor domain MASE1